MSDSKIKLPRIAGLRPEFSLLTLALALLIVAVAGFYYTLSRSQREADWVALVKQMQTDIGDISRVGSNAALGVPPDFVTLSGLTENFDANVSALLTGDAETNFKPLPFSVRKEVQELATAWQATKADIQKVTGAEPLYQRLTANVGTIGAAETAIFSKYQQIAERLGQRGAPSAQTYLAAGQLVRLERIRTDAENLLSKGSNGQIYSADLEKEVQAFVQAGQSLGGDALVTETNADFQAVVTANTAMQQDAPGLAALQESVAGLKPKGDAVLQTAKGLEQALVNNLVKRVLVPVMSYGAAGVAIVLLLLFIVITVRSARQRLREADVRDARQQQAILKLLDEITSIANGDLTGELTVTEDSTGNIADSLNYTVQTLRELVGTINQTSGEIGSAASATSASTQKMSKASEDQAHDIVLATQAINAASTSLTEMASNAERLALQAKSSVEVAHNGAATVGRTIAGMSSLREQIQDTAKRIKRLGESSQEIGEIIEFIDEIAEQTNTLALNASIQAAMAGEAGRGFAVVAEQVQQLAERAGSYTRQVETLVKTIQNDTQEAITSMERSTGNVVSGAQSAEEAGLALTRVEASSQELSRFIEDIAYAAREQSAGTTRLAGSMQGIREVAVQTSSAAAYTADSVGHLNLLAGKLRESVAGFKLPSLIF